MGFTFLTLSPRSVIVWISDNTHSISYGMNFHSDFDFHVLMINDNEAFHMSVHHFYTQNNILEEIFIWVIGTFLNQIIFLLLSSL
jgi:hypothetical protein